MNDRHPDEAAPRHGRADADGAPADEERAPLTPERLSDMDEGELRRLLHAAVGDLEPSPDSLERLRRAVPARRRRRRVAVGAVAAVVALGVTVPLLSNGVVPGLPGGEPSTVAHGEDTATPKVDRDDDDTDQRQRPSPRGEDHGGRGGDAPDENTSPSAGSTGSSDPNETLSGVSPSCTRQQLADGGSRSGPADASGRIRGEFVVVNDSDEPCTVDDAGLLAATPNGLAGSARRVQVLDNTGGPATTGLPSPEKEHDELVLRPQEAYVIRFVWLPEEGGGPSGCRADGGAGEEGDAAGTPQDGAPGDGAGGDAPSGPGGADGGGADAPGAASVLLGYTPGAGEPRISTLTLENACAGTVYRTGVLSAGD